jgi:glycosyltransferase involved in cell wall biosynthesis
MRKADLRIAYVPYYNVGNAYVNRMRDVLGQFGTVFQFIRPKQLVKEICLGKFKRYDVSIFNWTENEILDPRTHKVSWINACKVMIKMAFARVASRRLVFFRHNLYPHPTLPQDEKLVKRLLGWYEKVFSLVFVHSGAHLDDGRVYCPHPLYRRATAAASTSESDAAVVDGLPEDYFVVFGRIERYKRILELAQTFPSHKNLLIIGPISDEYYGKEIQGLGRTNIFYRPGFLSEAAAQNIILKSSAIVLAHAGENTVVSGSFFYAVSLLVPVLAVETPFLCWVAPRIGAELLVLAPDLPGLVEAARGFERCPNLAHLAPHVNDEFGDEAIANALAPALAGL